MNLAIKTQDDLTFRYPGNSYLGHLGEHADWPMEEGSARNLANYRENNIGGAKSYHVFGEHSNFFGVYYTKENYGVAHRADRDDKLGKKIFLWEQSRAGKIWEGLLTDGAGQYAEIQSGRLFNQNVFESSLSPFKQVSFQPYQTDQWTETWHPVSHLDGISYLDDRVAMCLNQRNNQVVLQLMSLQPLTDTIKIWGDE